MAVTSRDLLMRLGAGESIAAVCAAAGRSRAQFDGWWRDECRGRVPLTDGSDRVAGLRGAVQIRRDAHGIPHIAAANEPDLFFGFGYATAQDRLFQLDFLRRKARGRLAEVLGPSALEFDRLYRTLGLVQIAAAEWQSSPEPTRALIAAYAAGVNALIDTRRERLPIEFALLDYTPEPWSPLDSLVLTGEFRWYLTGRFPVIVVPELVKRSLGEGPLYHAFLQGEEDGESILPPGTYPQRAVHGKAGSTVSGDEGHGSNNWVIAGARTTTGLPLVANDPHVPFAAVSMWHEVHLCGGSFNVAGVAYAGMPALLVGRTEQVAWGITNNICSQRDLYLEQSDERHPGCFLFDGQWEAATERAEVIHVKGAASVVETVRASRNGPMVDAVLPDPARASGPVSLRWLGADPCGWLTALLAMNRARSAAEFREATRPWCVPTFNLVFADTAGQIGHQCVGRIPIRHIAERGYRPGWDPRHQWDGVIPFEAMPHQTNPQRGFAVTANNRLAPDDFPYPLSGTWATGHRARRIRTQLEASPRWSMDACCDLQQDVHSGRAADGVPHLLAVLGADADPAIRQAATILGAWDFRLETESIAAALFNGFFAHWCRTVTAARLPGALAEFAAPSVSGLATALLAGDVAGWFRGSSRRDAICTAFRAALDDLVRRLGPDADSWTWGRLHTLVQRHFLSGRGELGALLDRSGTPTRGDATTVCCSVPDPDYGAMLGAGYRMVADLADPRHGLWQIEVAGASGHPGSRHYDDQIAEWSAGGYHYIPLTGADEACRSRFVLEPRDPDSAERASS